MTITATPTTWSTKNKVGLALAIFYGLTNVPSVLIPAPAGDTGPPMGVMIVCSILGLVAFIGGIVAWRNGSRSTARLVAASVVIITLTSLPAFFVDVSAGLKALVAAGVLLTVAIVVLMFSPAKRQG